ncbi:MAG: hypothetical protein JWO94_1118 [Verrucomicrobiaceae bacterium]|nr:hypothetical protein [Verrucomicrobiaceae bacterium]
MSSQPAPLPPSPRRPKVLWLTLYYLAVLVAVIVLHARGNFTAPPFVYQGF